MSLTDKEIKTIKKALDESVRPLFFFDDDPDGTCAFVQLYKYKKEGHGVILKTGHQLTTEFMNKIDDYQPDLIIILDIPMVEQEFFDKVSQRVIWIDHHPVQNMKKVEYYNPRIHDENDNKPTSYWAYKIVKQDMWVGMTGTVADWQLTDLKDQFSKDFPELLPPEISKPDDALFDTKIGLLARIISFAIKGSARDAMKIIKILTRIEDPLEILDQTTPQGRFIYKKFEKYDIEYQELKSRVKVTKGPILKFIYSDNNTAVTSELSNELLHLHPDKLVIVGREIGGEVKMSLRSAGKKVLPILKKALEKTGGTGGGHDMACGSVVKAEHFEDFLEVFKTKLKD